MGYYAGLWRVASPENTKFKENQGQIRLHLTVMNASLCFQSLICCRAAVIACSQRNLCFGSQTCKRLRRSLEHMSAKYFTQFRLTDADYRGGNEFSGVVELSRPMDHDSDVTDIEAVLAKNFDLQRSAVQLVSWSRLH